jgi:E3 ubiquitin-protein ligase makorin
MFQAKLFNFFKCTIYKFFKCTHWFFFSKLAADSRFEVGECSNSNQSCSICLKGLHAIKKFGLFPNCDHPFCHECICGWRKIKTVAWNISKSCPMCRKFSFFIVPSFEYIVGEAKDSYIHHYLQRCR